MHVTVEDVGAAGVPSPPGRPGRRSALAASVAGSTSSARSTGSLWRPQGAPAPSEPPPADPGEPPDWGQAISLPPDLTAAGVTRPRWAIRVDAWVPWTDGVHRRIDAWACEWITGERARVRVRWHDARGLWDVWVWAAAVQRSATVAMIGPPATHRPGGGVEIPAWRRPAPEDQDERSPERRPTS